MIRFIVVDMKASSRIPTALLLIAAVVCANAAFTGLSAAFDYPHVLGLPTTEVLTLFRANQAAVTAWFGVLAVGAFLLAPIAIAIGRTDDSPLMRWGVRAGIAAAVVQVIGLLRWPLFVPFIAGTALSEGEGSTAARAFETANVVLGSFLGETLGYLLTATWTAIVAIRLSHSGFPRWFPALGVLSAGAIAVGVAAPWGVPGTQQVNFVGYILWSVWLLILSALWIRARRIPEDLGEDVRPVTGRFGSAGRQPVGAPAVGGALGAQEQIRRVPGGVALPGEIMQVGDQHDLHTGVEQR